MKIAYLSTFYPFRGGIAQFNASVFRELEKLGHDVRAYTFTTQYPKAFFPGETQFVTNIDNVDSIPSERILNSVNPLTYINSAKIIKKFEPDLLIMKFWMPFFGPSLGYVAGNQSKKTKVITILDNVKPHEPKFFDKAFAKYFLKRNNGFVVMSDKVGEDLNSFLPNAKYVNLPHPLYNHFGKIVSVNEARQKLNINPDKKTLLFFGFIREYKGLDILIKAMNLLDNSYQLVIAGEIYGNFEKYDSLISENKNASNIHKHVRYITDDEVSNYFSASDVCILPYKSATQSGITGISYYFELPMIATNVGGLSEIIIHEKTGLIVENPSETLLAAGIEKYFAEKKMDVFVQNIRNLKMDLSWDKFTSELISFSKNL